MRFRAWYAPDLGAACLYAAATVPCACAQETKILALRVLQGDADDITEEHPDLLHQSPAVCCPACYAMLTPLGPKACKLCRKRPAYQLLEQLTGSFQSECI